MACEYTGGITVITDEQGFSRLLLGAKQMEKVAPLKSLAFLIQQRFTVIILEGTNKKVIP